MVEADSGPAIDEGDRLPIDCVVQVMVKFVYKKAHYVARNKSNNLAVIINNTIIPIIVLLFLIYIDLLVFL